MAAYVGMFAWVLASVAFPRAVALAEDRPTSGDMSIASGRTVGVGETVVAAGIGWPGAWASLVLAPASTFNVELRGTVLYGSPVLGLGGGVGGEVAAKMRLHVYGEGQLDVSLVAMPAIFGGEGSLAGQEGTFHDDFGYGAYVELGAALGIAASRVVTIVLGAFGAPGFVSVPDVTGSDSFIGRFGAQLGIEALMARDTLLFALVGGGFGFAPDRLFDGHALLQVSFGVAYLL